MVDMTPQRWTTTNDYLEDVFGRQDAELAMIVDEARRAGLPDIAVSAVVGRLLMMLTTMTVGKLVLEIGTLGGYSAAWLVRGMARSGRLITIEIEQRNAEFAAKQFERLGIADRIEIRRGDAAHVLVELAAELPAGSVDVVFLDADKEQYPLYWKLVRPLIAVGGLLVIDNALGAGSWWIDDDHPSRRAADTTNRQVAGDGDFQAVAFPLRQGVLVARRMR